MEPAYRGVYVDLRAVARNDYGVFLRWRTDIGELHIWAPSRRVPTVDEAYEEIERGLKESVTFIAVSKESEAVVGFVQAFNFSPKDGWCFFQGYLPPQDCVADVRQEAISALLDYLFQNFDFRKVYVDERQNNAGLLTEALRAGFREEGRFTDHTWHDFRYWDVVRLALYREDWQELRRSAAIVLGVGTAVSEVMAKEGT